MRKLPEMSDAVTALNPGLNDPETQKIPAITKAEISAKDTKAEKAFQLLCEQYLQGFGYYRRSPEWIRTSNAKGCFVHLAKPRGNPILLDLLILNYGTGQYIEIELKTPTGPTTDEQEHIIQASDSAHLCRDFDDFVMLVLAFDLSCDREQNPFYEHFDHA